MVDRLEMTSLGTTLVGLTVLEFRSDFECLLEQLTVKVTVLENSSVLERS